MPSQFEDGWQAPSIDDLRQCGYASRANFILMIRKPSACTSIAEVDDWENAADREDAARDKAKAAKQAYEDALREKFFHF